MKSRNPGGLAVLYSPNFEGPIEGWVVNGMKANYFRVENTHSREEYLQEAYLVFLRVKRKYEGKVEEPKHFMSLFKRAWTNELNDLATKATNARMLVAMPMLRSDDGDELEYEPMGELDNEGFLAVLVRQAPREVSMVLNLFCECPSGAAGAGARLLARQGPPLQPRRLRTNLPAARPGPEPRCDATRRGLPPGSLSPPYR
jgi:hypothetical protein